MAASLYCSGFSERYFEFFRDPSGALATISVNVPPRSIQNCHLPSEVSVFITFLFDTPVIPLIDQFNNFSALVLPRNSPMKPLAQPFVTIIKSVAYLQQDKKSLCRKAFSGLKTYKYYYEVLQ